MALIHRGSRYALCGEVLTSPFVATSGCAFWPNHRLFRFCDAPLHLSCLEVWPDRQEFARAYYDGALEGCRAGDQTRSPILIHESESWFLCCGPSTPESPPYYARVWISDWPFSLYGRFEKWDSFVAQDYRTSFVGAALLRADEIMSEVRSIVPTLDALRQALANSVKDGQR